MTYPELEQFRACVIAGSLNPDPSLWAEASRRYDEAERALSLFSEGKREEAATELYKLLPGDWPLWMEACREQGSGGLHWRAGLPEGFLVPCRGGRRAGWAGSASMRH